MSTQSLHGTYGHAPRDLAPAPEGALSYSPFEPGAGALDAIPEGSLQSFTLLAPPGTIERQYVLALALRALALGGTLTALAPKDKGGSRLGKELAAFGCVIDETSRRHHRIVRAVRPAQLRGLDAAFQAGALQEANGRWTQPGIFSWDRLDPGTALLLKHLPPLEGKGADFGCGTGVLAQAVLESPKVVSLLLLDLDRRAVEAAKRNVADPRAECLWADLRHAPLPKNFDFVVMNPPFHDQGVEDRGLGQRFVERAAESLRPGGTCWLTANRHLPYEAVLARDFATATLRAEGEGFKVYEAVR